MTQECTTDAAVELLERAGYGCPSRVVWHWPSRSPDSRAQNDKRAACDRQALPNWRRSGALPQHAQPLGVLLWGAPCAAGLTEPAGLSGWRLDPGDGAP